MTLCSNRPEGFGPHSNLSSPLPTSCFTDTILIPLPIWFALVLLPILFILSIHHRKQHFDPSTAYLRHAPKSNWGYRIVAGIYYALIICNILMMTLEIVRLELLHFGIGLLFIAYIGLILGAVLHRSEGLQGTIRGWQAINGVLWIGGGVMSAVQVIGLGKEGINGRKGSKYPISDQVIDVAVMAGVYAVTAILELVLGFWRVSRRTKAMRKERPQSGTSPFATPEPGKMFGSV